jgi:N-methylhydantoinase B
VAVRTLDAIDLEILRNAFDTIAREMSYTLERTARSPIANETRDYSTSLLDARGRLVAQGLGTPILMGASKWSLHSILDEFRFDLHAGDIFLNNDPYSGGSHLGDCSLAMPVFHRNKLVLFPVARSHLPDAGGGGTNPGGFNPLAIDSYEEAIRIPPLRVGRSGALKHDVYDWVIRNCRLTEWTQGDLDAMLAACKIVERRINELMARYGEDGILQAVDYAIDYAERRFREEIASWPDGEYEGESFLDSDGPYTKDIRLHVKITVTGDSLTLDWSGSSPQTRGFANSPIGNTWTHPYIALCSLIDESIPKNEGIYRSVTLIAPEGTVVNPREGAPNGCCTIHPGAEIGEAVMLALARAIPEKVSLPLDKKAQAFLSGTDPRRESRPYYSLNFVASYGGASGTFGLDGWGGLGTARGTMAYTTAEMTEVQYPHRVEEREFITDSCGPGRWRGGMGVSTVLRIIDHEATDYSIVWGGRHPETGFCGGASGAPNRIHLRYGSPDELVLRGGDAAQVPLGPGERLYVVKGGGGGWGDPLERDPTAVREDVLDEYVSPERARADYGVILDPATLEIDWHATTAERAGRNRGSGPKGARPDEVVTTAAVLV